MRLIAPRELVFALCAGLDSLEAAFDREINSLIITDLEMQERPVDDASPVSAVEGLRTDQVERAGNRSSTLIGNHEKAPVGHTLVQ